MCAVSFIGEFYRDKITGPGWEPVHPYIPTTTPGGVDGMIVTQQELDRFRKETGDKYDELKKQMEEMKELLLRAKKYDEETGQPDCEMEDKVALLKQMARLFDVDLSQVFGGTK